MAGSARAPGESALEIGWPLEECPQSVGVNRQPAAVSSGIGVSSTVTSAAGPTRKGSLTGSSHTPSRFGVGTPRIVRCGKGVGDPGIDGAGSGKRLGGDPRQRGAGNSPGAEVGVLHSDSLEAQSPRPEEAASEPWRPRDTHTSLVLAHAAALSVEVAVVGATVRPCHRSTRSAPSLFATDAVPACWSPVGSFPVSSARLLRQRASPTDPSLPLRYRILQLLVTRVLPGTVDARTYALGDHRLEIGFAQADEASDLYCGQASLVEPLANR